MIKQKKVKNKKDINLYLSLLDQLEEKLIDNDINIDQFSNRAKEVREALNITNMI